MHIGLPSPAVVQGHLPTPRRASSSLLELDGSAFDPLTAQRVSAQGSAALFEPDWLDGSSDSSGLACAIYQFGMLGYTGAQTLQLTWTIPPAEEGVLWLGLSDWAAGHWDWFAPQPGGIFVPPGGLAQYTQDGTSSLLVAVVVLGTEPYTLQRLSIGASLAGDWRMTGHDAQHTSRSAFISSQTGVLKWQFDLEEGYSASSAVFDSAGAVYFTAIGPTGGIPGMVYALNSDGSLKWRYDASLDYLTEAALGRDGALYFGTSSGFCCLNPDGTLRWTANQSHTYWDAPILGPDDSAYICVDAHSTNLQCLLPDGSQAWLAFASGEFNSGSPSLLPGGALVLLCIPAFYTVIDGAGTNVSYAETGFTAHMTPAVAPDGTFYFGSNSDTPIMEAWNPLGFQVWQCSTPEILVSSPGLGPDGTIYSSDRDGMLYAINPDGTLKWTATAGGSRLLAVGADGVVYAGGADERLHAISPDGTELWSADTPGVYGLAPSIANDGTLIVCGKGWVRAYGD